MHLSSTLLLSTLLSLSLAVPTPVNRDASDFTQASSAQASVPPGLLSWMHQTTPAGVNMFLAEQRLTGSYIFKAFNSESPIHLKPISGDNGLFYVGAPGANMSSEVISVDIQGAAKLGQRPIYIDPHSALAYFSPSSTSSGGSPSQSGRPGGTIFDLTANPSDESQVALIFSGVGKGIGWYACSEQPQTGPWQVFANTESLEDANVPGGDLSNCDAFDALGNAA
ncbi:MAG: hypothetical protein Q9214_001887 [Letrouitia sp. 1 TL-2023]